VAPITAVIMLIGTTTHLDPLVAAFLRVGRDHRRQRRGRRGHLADLPGPRPHLGDREQRQKMARLLAELLEHYALKLKGGGPTWRPESPL
jgi:hypothetical protein